MGEENPLLRIIGGTSRRPASFVGLVAAFLAAMAGNAGATVQIQNQNDPAGDPTVVGYTLTPPPGQGAPVNFSLHDGEYRGLGPYTGQVVVQAVLPAGWRVEHISCYGFNLNHKPTAANVFAIDEANGRVTMQHAVDDDQFCTFTNGKALPGGGSSGVSPAPPPNLAPNLVPNKTALLGVKARRGYAVATVRLIRRSVIKSVLSRRGKAIGSSRVVRNAGTYDVTVSIKPSIRRALKKQGLKRVSTQLKVVVAGTTVKTTRVFGFRVLVPV
jgi:hypothetical protein